MLIKIGPFSKLAQIPVSQLRYYADIGLMQPAHIDPFTGYRYYDLDQLPQLNRILALRDLGLGLEQIVLMLRDGVKAEELRGMLRLQRARVAQELAETELRLRQVEARLNRIEKEGIMPTHEIVVKTAPAMTIASVREVVPTIAEVGGRFSVIFNTLNQWMQANHVKMAGPSLALYYNESYTETDVEIEPAFVIDPATPDGSHTVNGLTINVRKLAEETAATVVHHGPYDTLTEAHLAVITWAAENGWKISGAPREIYLSMPGEKQPLTEIAYPVSKA